MKTLVIAHGHPDQSIGGGEIAALRLHHALAARSDVGEAVFLARSADASRAMGAIERLRPGEYLWRQEIGDWNRLRTGDPVSMWGAFPAFLERLRPDVVFVQHYVHIGIDMLRAIRRTLPKTRIVMTLHEYVAICHNHGQMVKPGGRKLCDRESPTECHACFPTVSAEDFWLRKHFIQRHFELVDHFVAPSHFLKKRHVEWGIPAEWVSVIENGHVAPPVQPERPDDDGRVKLAFFGQITPFKGLDILLQAMHRLRPDQRAKVRLDIHAAQLEAQDEWYRTLIEKLRQPLIADGSLRWVGPYQPGEVGRRMAATQWIVVPSIWWENSPMVIQEAFACDVPVIASGIGGMAEKVRDGVDGLHFEAQNPHSLADVLVRIGVEPQLHQTLVRNIRRPASPEAIAEAYLALARA